MTIAHTGHGLTLAVTIGAPVVFAMLVGVAAWRRAPDPDHVEDKHGQR